ncbi:hypothetical protein FRC01_003384 [Tulasnella sp. 417]|nr:hypothetical protein FRC01_003384 [Tulasnella sp. 417]
MSSASRAPYQRLATRSPSPPVVPSAANQEEEIDLDELTRNDPRFNPPPPPWWQRALLIIFVIFMHWVAWKLIPVGDKPIEYPDDSCQKWVGTCFDGRSTTASEEVNAVSAEDLQLKLRAMCASPPAVDLALLKQFRFEKILDSDPVIHRIVLLGTLPTLPTDNNDGPNDRSPAIISLQKTHFSAASSFPVVEAIGDFKLIEQNDIYSEGMGWYFSSSTEHDPDLKISIITNATPLHIAKKSKQKQFLIRETPEIYRSIVSPYITTIPPERTQWVINILSHKTEVDKILFEDPSPTDGFIVLPDFKWDCTTISQLYLVALVHASDIKSLRDLRKCHINLLKSIRREVARVSMEKWGIGRDSLRMFIHYQPSYYHLHVHAITLEMEGWKGMSVAHAHLLDDVISLLESEAEGVFERMTLTYAITELHPLWDTVRGAQEAF